jgi:hypothetical protein
VGEINLIKTLLLLKIEIFIIMGRPKKNTEEKKVKVSISLDRKLYNKIKSEKIMPSRIIEKLIREYYGNKNLQ